MQNYILLLQRNGGKKNAVTSKPHLKSYLKKIDIKYMPLKKYNAKKLYNYSSKEVSLIEL